MTLDELETIIAASGLNYSDFARAIDMTPEGFRRMRRDVRERGGTIGVRLAGAVYHRFGIKVDKNSVILGDAFDALIDLCSAFPDDSIICARARHLIERARQEGLFERIRGM
jgi:membrane glycosyltransferase